MKDLLKQLKVYNTLSKKKELFEPVNAPNVGMYVCGPTVYSDVHLGNVRTFISFDIIYRYLKFLGYNVRYVRNITDVGHLENDSDQGEDKISKKAKAQNLEPMQIVKQYTNGFHQVMEMVNTLPVDIEPTATGHITEQIEWTKTLIEKGFAYEVNGSVYFDNQKYNAEQHFGKLSGRKIDDTLEGTRNLDGQSEKRSPVDFAVWKKADPKHIMRWPSPWGEGFPGWHMECSVMAHKYLGEEFDIHGGGMDLIFPHHECEIAQSKICTDKDPAKYWLHTNMLTVNGTKMSKSLGNSFLPHELFTGDHKLLAQPYSPMTLRFFMLQTHYSSTMDFSNEALSAAKKGYHKLINTLNILKGLEYPQEQHGAVNPKQEDFINKQCDNCYYAMNDDFNTARTIAALFNLSKKINGFGTGQLALSEISLGAFERLKHVFISMVEDVLGLKEEKPQAVNIFIDALLDVYKQAKSEKDYDKVDQIRAKFKTAGILIKDMKNSVSWAYEE